MEILINSSKTMISAPGSPLIQKPLFQAQAKALDAILKTKDHTELRALMHISPKLAVETEALIKRWNTRPKQQTLALDAFRGDIYRGLIAQTLSEDERVYGNQTLRILSGLYGMLRPFDGIMPYRLELYYRLSGDDFQGLYQFWGDRIAKKLAKRGLIVNLASQEYVRVVEPYVDPKRIVEPQFLTRMADAEPTFVAVHAKVARGAFARWLIVTRITDPAEFRGFSAHDYRYDPAESTPEKPVFVKRLG